MAVPVSMLKTAVAAFVVVAALLVAAWPGRAQPTAGPSGLPLPRFVSMASNEVNVRAGPGPEYPIKWTYVRRDLPVKIIEEYDVWRKIEDPEGDEGWVHSSLLSSKRTALVVGAIEELHRTASDDSRIVLRAEPGVVAELIDCTAEWCLLEIAERRGWAKRAGLWGLLEDEMQG